MELLALVVLLCSPRLISSVADSQNPPSPSLAPVLDQWEETHFVYQIPPNPVALIFLAHGCSARFTSFWDQNPNCQICRSLPEERALALTAMQRHYAVVTINSMVSDSWQDGYLVKVRSVLKYLGQKKELHDLPLFAAGAGDGGDFVSKLGFTIEFQAIALTVSAGDFKTEFDPKIRSYPPVLFVHMPKDEKTADLVAKSIQNLKNRGVSVVEIQCHEVQVSAGFLRQRIQGMDENLAGKIVAVLKENGVLDYQGYLKRDPWSVNWQMPLKKRNVLNRASVGKLKLEEEIQQELNVAFAYHEMTSLPAQQIFEWFAAHTPSISTI